jgi:hypothetical protein
MQVEECCDGFEVITWRCSRDVDDNRPAIQAMACIATRAAMRRQARAAQRKLKRCRPAARAFSVLIESEPKL